MEPPDAEQRAARTRRLYRYISEAIRKVDEGTSRSKTVPDLFSASLEIHRQKLRENCEKLIFADPLLYGRKAQELLWRKGYYEAVSAAKRLHVNNKSHDELVLAHIYSGIGHYHNLISRIQMEMDISMTSMLDYPIVDVEFDRDDSKSFKPDDLIQWAKSAIQISLVYLGDLSRYKTEYEDTLDNSMSVRYYLQASGIDPKVGMPYNQLGTLFTGKYHSLDSVRYYIICLSCETPFDGAEGNLIRIFDRNNKYLEMMSSKPSENIDQQESIKNFICKFLSLVDCWYFDKNTADFNEMCTSALYELKECLQFAELNVPDKNLCQADIAKHIKDQELNPDHLNYKVINKIVLIIFLCINKLQKENSSQLFSLKAFALAFLSQMLHKLLSILIEMGFEVQSPEQIIEERKERMKNYKNVKSQFKSDVKSMYERKIADDNATINVDEIKGKDSSEESSKEQKKSVLNEEKNDTENLENQDVDSQENKEVNSQENKDCELDKSVKSKNKKNAAKILRRRRRRLSSTESIDDSESDFSSDISDLEDKSVEDESESENDNISEASYFTYTSSDDEIDDNDTEDIVEDKQNNPLINGDNGNDCDDSIKSKPENEIPDINFENNTYNKGKVKFNEDLLHKFLETNDILAVIRLLLSWLHSEADFLFACRFNGRALFQTLVDILNIVNRQIFPRLSKNLYNIDQQYNSSLHLLHEKILTLKYRYKSVPLPEDYDVKSVDLLKPCLKDIDWNIHKQLNLSEYDNNAIRFLSFIDFGVFIVKLKIGIIFNRRLKMYTFKRSKINKRTLPNMKKFSKESKNFNSKILKQTSDVNGSGSQSEGLMRNLGKLWLSAQVRELESEVRAGKHQHGSPAYVVVDAEALSKHTYLIKRLVSSKKLIVLIPSIVLQVMDELKKESGGARSAIRWLEFQLRNGSRFLRTQRSTETISIPNIKYPKKMTKDMHNYVQIMEFCYYFLSQESNFNFSKSVENECLSDSANKSSDNETGETIENSKTSVSETDHSNVLVLLTGSKQSETPDGSELTFIGLAKLAGVPVENIQDFCLKMKNLFSKTGKYR